jgi:hypothetical protein
MASHMNISFSAITHPRILTAVVRSFHLVTDGFCAREAVLWHFCPLQAEPLGLMSLCQVYMQVFPALLVVFQYFAHQ